MPTRRRAQRRPLAVMALALVVASVAAATTVGAAASSDDAIEKRVVLRWSDFPAGWEKATRRDATISGLSVCAGIDGVNAALAPLSTRSPNFVRPDTDNVLVNNAVVVFRSVKQAKGYLEPYRDPAAVQCLEALTEATLLEASFSGVRVYATPSDDVPSGADDAAAFALEITVTAPATASRPTETAVIHQDVVVVRVGRALANFGFLSPVRPLTEQGELIDIVIGRMQDALGQ